MTRRRPPPARIAAAACCALVALLAAGCAEGEAEAVETAAERGPTSGSETAPNPGTAVHRYLAMPSPEPEEAEAALDALSDALELWRRGEHREGARAADAALARLPTLADWRPLVRAELLAPEGDTAEVRAALGELDPATGIGARWGWEILVQAYEAAGDSVGARAAAEEAAASDAVHAPSAAWLRAGRLALAAGDSAGARGAFWRAVEQGERDAPARSAARLLDDLSPAPEADPARDLQVGRALLAASEWRRALRRLEPLLPGDGGTPGSPLGEADQADIRVGLGRALLELARYADAEAMLAPLTGEAVAAELAAPALHWTGRVALARGDGRRAEDTFVRLARRAPGSPLAEEGLLLALDRASDRGGPADVERIMSELLTFGVTSSAGELQAVRFGARMYLEGRYDQAATAFERYLDAGRRASGRQQATYWAALAHQRLGGEERARDLLEATYRQDPLSFYGTFAADRLDAPLLPPDLPAGPPPVPGIEGELRNALLRLHVHQRVPTTGSFDFELARLRRHFLSRGDAAYDFAERLLAGELPIQSMVLGREIHREEGEWNLRLLRIVYPFPYRDEIVREASRRGLDPFFVAGLIRQESMFHPTIRSPAGAVGLMQLLPSTAQEVARAEGMRFTPAALGDPEVNLRLGTAFLASMVARFDGRAEDALSAYNAGPARARQWRTRPEYRDTDVFIEHIPFAETRHYVKVVQQNTRIYTALYGCAGEGPPAGGFEPCLGLSYRAALERSPVAGGAPTTIRAR